MSWIYWTVVVIIGLNIAFFGALAIIAYLEERRRKK